jgi:hypothetical protein
MLFCASALQRNFIIEGGKKANHSSQTAAMSADGEWEVLFHECDDMEPGVNAVFDIAKQVMLASIGRHKAVVEGIRADILTVAKEEWTTLGLNRWHMLKPVFIHTDDEDFFKEWEPEWDHPEYPVLESEFIDFSTEVKTVFTHQPTCKGDRTDCCCRRLHRMTIEMALSNYDKVTVQRKRTHDKVEQ